MSIVLVVVRVTWEFRRKVWPTFAPAQHPISSHTFDDAWTGKVRPRPHRHNTTLIPLLAVVFLSTSLHSIPFLSRSKCLRRRDRQHWRCAVRLQCLRPAVRANLLTASPAKPMTAVTPFKVAAASISQSTKKPAQEVAPVRGYGSGNVKGNPGPPPSMKALSKKMDQEVPLASQEGNKSAVQYAL